MPDGGFCYLYVVFLFFLGKHHKDVAKLFGIFYSSVTPQVDARFYFACQEASSQKTAWDVASSSEGVSFSDPSDGTAALMAARTRHSLDVFQNFVVMHKNFSALWRSFAHGTVCASLLCIKTIKVACQCGKHRDRFPAQYRFMALLYFFAVFFAFEMQGGGC